MANFSPRLLVGGLYQFWGSEIRLVEAPWRDHRHHHAAEAVIDFLRSSSSAGQLLHGYHPVDSRGGLVVLSLPPPPPPAEALGRPSPSAALCVCNPMTRQCLFLPRGPAILDESHVLLTGDGGCSFQLLAVNLELLEYKVFQVQTFSSKTGRWGPVVGTFADLPPSSFLRPSPLVLNGAAYWLCRSEDHQLGCCYVLELRLDGSRPPAPIKLPAELLRGRTNVKRKELLLASSADGRLGLALVSNSYTISLWTLVSTGGGGEPARWRRSRVIDLVRVTAEAPPLDGEKIRLECFAERSGAVLFQMYRGTLYELSLLTGEVRFAGVYSKSRSSSPMCAYDMDPALLTPPGNCINNPSTW